MKVLVLLSNWGLMFEISILVIASLFQALLPVDIVLTAEIAIMPSVIMPIQMVIKQGRLFTGDQPSPEIFKACNRNGSCSLRQCQFG